MRWVRGVLFGFGFLIVQPLAAQPMSDCQLPVGFSSFTAVNFSGSSSLLWAYRASDGLVCIDSLNLQVGGFSPGYRYQWAPGFTGFAGFSLQGASYVWAYRASDGLVTIHKVMGNGFVQKCYYVWDRGFTSFVALYLSGQTYIWAYRASDGMVCIHRISSDATHFTQTGMYKWDTGFSGFTAAGPYYVWAYRASDGTTTIHQLNLNGTGFTQRFYYKWDVGFSGFASIDLSDGPYVWAYRASDGTVCIHKILSGGTGFQQREYYKWDTAVSNLAGLGGPYVWAFKARGPKASTICMHRVNAMGSTFTQIFYDNYDCAWHRSTGWITEDDFRAQLDVDMDGSTLRVSSQAQTRGFFGFWVDVTTQVGYTGSFSSQQLPAHLYYSNPFTLTASSAPLTIVHFDAPSSCFLVDHGSYKMVAPSPGGATVNAAVTW